MIVMDLEWNRSYDRKRLDEILQIGAVRIDAPGGPILSTFNVFIRPRVHKRFDPGARKLPDLQESVNSGTTFAEAWAEFTDWCGEERVFAFWGPDDFGVIRQNCASAGSVTILSGTEAKASGHLPPGSIAAGTASARNDPGSRSGNTRSRESPPAITGTPLSPACPR